MINPWYMVLFSVPMFSAMFLLGLIFLVFPLRLYLLIMGKLIIFEWVFFSSLVNPMVMTFILDPYGVVFCLVVLFISFNVLIFSHRYIREDIYISRFIYIVLLFVFSINFLIFIPNLISLLLGWDGLGLVSFLLVIYYQNAKSLGAGIITALTNRIGDVFILVSIGYFVIYGHWNILISWERGWENVLGITIIVAGMTKSAQFPFCSWLPAAIAAPTPVSALVHSSTLVTAGVFLLFRFYPFLSCSLYFNKILLILGTITALMAGISAMVECDMKKIIALSTLSQLGVIIVSMGMGVPILSFFHLLTHAIFKALLFLCAGALINLHGHSQDLRFIGNIRLRMPLLCSRLVVSNLALCGAPFIAGFYSKDLVLEFSLYSPVNLVVIMLFFFATGLTARYTIRFLVSVVWGSSLSLPYHPVCEGDLFISVPTFNLSLFGVCGGCVLNWLVICPVQDFFLPSYFKLLALFVTLVGGFISWGFSCQLNSVSYLKENVLLNFALCSMWFLTPLSSQKMLSGSFWLGHNYYKVLDQGWEEILGGQGVLLLRRRMSSFYQIIQGNIYSFHLFIRGVFLFFFIILLFLYSW